MTPGYRGRFAPTPSGPLHFGSLVAALGGYLDARAQGGEWLLRIEDIDPPRVVAGAADAILRALEAHGLEWDGPVVHQSRHFEAYRAALDELARKGLLYGCACSRKAVAASARHGVDGPVYPGTCRARGLRGGVAWRLRVDEARVAFDDRALGHVACDIARECGDFVLRRADGVFAYQLAVVVDDAAQGITDVVRGADLLVSTPRQIVVQRALGLPTPSYLHLPVALDAAGAKLSKQTLAAPLDDAKPLAALRAAARFLGLGDIEADSPAAFLKHAAARWRPEGPTPALLGKRLPTAASGAQRGASRNTR